MIKLNNISKSYNGTLILNDICYEFPSHGITCLVGASGCGKSTLLNLISGFDREYEGEIEVLGAPLKGLGQEHLAEYRKNMTGFIFQEYHLISGYSVLENILLAAQLNGKSREENQKEALLLLERLGIGDKLNQKIENLSGGQKQRVAIARALINDPPILFADEPTGALDRKTTEQIMEILQQIAKTRLVIMVTHDKKIYDYANEVITIIDGKIEKVKEMNQNSGIQKERHNFSPIRSMRTNGIRNFKNHLVKYMIVAFSIAMGVSGVLFSLSSRNIIDRSITDFKEKNTAFLNGYISLAKNETMEVGGILELLSNNPYIENYYVQYPLDNITISYEDTKIDLDRKLPGSIANETMTLGVMPRSDYNEIAISPSLAKKLTDQIQDLIGKRIVLNQGDKNYEVVITGIFNYAYDNYYVSRNVEEMLYENIKNEDVYSISYEVNSFEKVPLVERMLKSETLRVDSVADQIDALNGTFHQIEKIFFMVTIFILLLSLFISGLLIIKLTNSRGREIGLLSALGYSNQMIKQMLFWETVTLMLVTLLCDVMVMGLMKLVLNYGFHIEVSFKVAQIGILVISSVVIASFMSNMASARLRRIDPAKALRA